MRDMLLSEFVTRFLRQKHGARPGTPAPVAQQTRPNLARYACQIWARPRRNLKEYCRGPPNLVPLGVLDLGSEFVSPGPTFPEPSSPPGLSLVEASASWRSHVPNLFDIHHSHRRPEVQTDTPLAIQCNMYYNFNQNEGQGQLFHLAFVLLRYTISACRFLL